MEYERIRREKLELQLDNCRQELEKSIRSLRDYETKVVVLERYLQITSKQEAKAIKKSKQESVSKTPPKSATRSKSQTKNSSTKEREVTSATLTRKNSKSNYSESNFKSFKHDILDVKEKINFKLKNFFLRIFFLISEFIKFSIKRITQNF